MREWFVAGAVIEVESLRSNEALDESGLLLVENERHGGRRDWTPPGGVIDHGESLRSGLVREVQEETGLSVVSWFDLLYEVRIEAPDLGWRLSVEVHHAEAVEGELSIGGDPDGIVVGANWANAHGCPDLLSTAPRWVAEPLLEWVTERFVDPRTFVYSVRGTSPSNFLVERRPS